MNQKIWTEEQLAAAYAEMAQINLQLCEEFMALEEEADTLLQENLLKS